MAALTPLEIGQFVSLFNRGGYVLNFSTNEFDVFTMRSVGVALCMKYQLSKGKSLMTFLEEASDYDKLKLIRDLFDYYEHEYVGEFTEWLQDSSYDPKMKSRYELCKAILERVESNAAPFAESAEKLKEQFSSVYLNKQIDLMMKMQAENPTEAIGKAKELIESCCKTILDERGMVWDKDWSVTNLAGETMEQLKLMPENIPDTATESKSMKALLGNLLQVATRMAELRNPYGSGHGKSASYKGLEERHAKLAVGASITFVSFLWDTHEKRKQS